MDFDFTPEESLFLYGYFKKKIKQLKLLKETPSNPICHETINIDINLYSSITDKIEKVYPNLSKLNEYI